MLKCDSLDQRKLEIYETNQECDGKSNNNISKRMRQDDARTKKNVRF
jgi:hypothetical protein